MADTLLPNGFAIRRNGTCLAVEVDCGQTQAPYHGCCPSGTVCPSQYNIACCPQGDNCTEPLVATPHCANSSWTMYNNGGYFCCDSGTLGYAAVSTNSDGCLLPVGAPPSNIQLLAVVSQTVISGSSTVVASSTVASSSTSTASSSSISTTSLTSTVSPISSNMSLPSTGTSDNSSLGAGAIAGIIVGIVLGIAILTLVGCLFYRRNKKKSPLTFSGYSGQDGGPRKVYAHELGGVNRQELPTTRSMVIPNQKSREYSELPAGNADHMI